MNTKPPYRILAALLLALAILSGPNHLACADDGPTAEFHWVDTPGKYLELHYGDRPVLRYMYRALDESSAQARFETYKVFHHLFDPAGKVLFATNGPTSEVPYSKDVQYPHHRGLYYGFNRIVYGDGKKADTWHCNRGESQQHVNVLDSGADGDIGWHRVVIDWHGQDGNVFAKEDRGLAVSLPNGGTQLDFVSSLRAVTGGPVHLDGDPQHAGFQFRATDAVAKQTKGDTYYLRTDGKGQPGETRNWGQKNGDSPRNKECTNRPWNAMSFVVAGDRYTALYIDHPDNPKPARYSERDYGRFGSYFVYDLQPAKPLIVRYRLWLQEGEMTVEECQRLCRDFVDSPSDNNASGS